MSTDALHADNRRATFLMVFAMAAFACEDTFLKIAAQKMPPGLILVISGGFGALIFGLLATWKGEKVLSLRALQGHALWRNAAEGLAAFCYILALALVPLAFASALMQATPLLVTAGAALFMGEKVGWRRWTSIVIGFIGVLVILQPWSEGVSLAGIFMIFCVIGLALRDLITRRMPKDLGTMSVSAWAFAAIALAGFALMAVQGDTFVMPSFDLWVVLAFSIIFALVGYYAVVEAMRIGEVSAVAPFRYTRLLFAFLLAVLFLGEKITLNLAIGSALIIFSGIYVFMRARKSKAALSQSAAQG